jgi:hypothetical protein
MLLSDKVVGANPVGVALSFQNSLVRFDFERCEFLS